MGLIARTCDRGGLKNNNNILTTKTQRNVLFKEIDINITAKNNSDRTIIVNFGLGILGSTSQIMTINEIIMFQVKTFRLRRLRQAFVASGLVRPLNLHNETERASDILKGELEV